ncbi:hypothetical protein CP8484711_1119B, partial [Chlamydia psittaci 84-8471/1]
ITFPKCLRCLCRPKALVM